MKGYARDRFRMLIGDLLGVSPDHVTLFARGRVAFYAILRALDIGPGDEVILPAFTCVAVPNAILYAGARPVWADIDPRTLCIDPAAAGNVVTTRTRAILAQNTFGLSADLDQLLAVADRHGLTVIDDCAHGLGGRYRNRPNGATAPVSFFSTQWSKPVSTGLGGFVVATQGKLADRLRAVEMSAAEPSPVRVAAIRALLVGREHAGGGQLFRAGRAAYRALGRRGLVPGSSSQLELEGSEQPHSFLVRLSESQAQLGCERLSRLGPEVERRREIANRYTEWLALRGRTAAVEPVDAEHSYLRYPIRVSDRPRFLVAGQREGVDLGDWFVSPVHPVTTDLERWGYVSGHAPNAEAACREVVNLPTDPYQRDRDIDRVLGFLGRSVDLIR